MGLSRPFNFGPGSAGSSNPRAPGMDLLVSALAGGSEQCRQFARDAGAVANTRVDWIETPSGHIFRADLPGLSKSEIKVQVEDGNMLHISGERRKEELNAGDKTHRLERAHGSFLRRFRLPENTDLDSVKAQAENGVLTVTVAKTQKPKPQSRAISIQ